MEHDPVEAIVGDWLSRRMREGSQSVEDLVREHPEHAEVLRRRVAALDDAGLLRPAGSAPKALAGETPRIAGFEILREIGRGGMGIVYEAWQPVLERRVAVKVIARSGLHDAHVRERFEREITTLARIRHPNIVKVFESGSVGGSPYVVMELVEGEPLASGIPPGGGAAARDQVARLLRLSVKVARALDHAHEQGVVHRDVKPSNIVVGPSGEPVLLDFGLARAEDRESLTRTGEFVGTLAYTAPEQALGERVDRRADVFGLGAVLYHLLTGSPPYPARSLSDLVRRIQSGPPSSASRLNRALSRDLSTVLERATAPSARERYASCADLADDLQAVLDGRPIRARRIGRAGRILRWAKRKPASAALVAVLPVALVLAGWIIWQLWSERRAADQADFAAHLDRAEETVLFDPRPTDASEALDALCRRRPEESRAWVLRLAAALIHPGAGKWSRAKPSIKQIEQASLLLREMPEIVRGRPACRLVDEWLAALRAGGSNRGKRWQPALPIEPLDDLDREELALVRSRLLGESEQAARLLREVLGRQPTNFGALRLFALFERDSGSLESYLAAAMAHYLRPNASMPLATLALASLARARRDEGFDSKLVDEALELIERAHQMDPTNSFVLGHYGYIVHEVKRPGWEKRSEDLYRLAIEHGSNPVARFNLKNLLVDSKSTNYREILDLLIEIEGDYGYQWQHWQARAWARWKLEGIAAALEELERGRELVAPEGMPELLGLVLEYRMDLEGAENTLAMQATWDELEKCVEDDLLGMKQLGHRFLARDADRRQRWVERCKGLLDKGVELSEDVIAQLRKLGPLPASTEESRR